MGAKLVPLGAAAATAWQVSEDLVDTVRNTPRPRPVRIAAEPQDLLIDLSRTGMVVIDMQNDFCAKGGWLDHIGVDITPVRKPIGPLRSLLPALRDCGVPVVWVNWGNRPDRLNLSPSLLHALTQWAPASALVIRCPTPAPASYNATVGLPLLSTSVSRQRPTYAWISFG